MRQAKKLGVLGLVLGLVAALGLVAGGIREAQAQAVNTCVPGTTPGAATTSCTFTLTTTVAPGGTLNLNTTTAGVTITGVSTAGGGLFGACTTPPFGGLVGIGTNTVVIGPCPPATNIPAGTAITVTFAVPAAGVTAIAFNAVANANGPIPGAATVAGVCGSQLAAAPPNQTVQCSNTLPGGTTAGNSLSFVVTPVAQTLAVTTAPATVGTCTLATGIPTPASAAPVTVTYTCGAGQSAPAGTIVNLTLTVTAGAAGATPTEVTNTNIGAAPVPAPTTQAITFTSPITPGNTGSAATKACTGTGVQGTSLTCTVVATTNAIPVGGSLQVTETNPGWTVTACTGVAGTTTAVLSGTTICIFQNATGAALPAGTTVGTETILIPTAAPVGTLVTETASTCTNAVAPCTVVVGSTANSTVIVTGVTVVVAAAAASANFPRTATLTCTSAACTSTSVNTEAPSAGGQADLATGTVDLLGLTGTNTINAALAGINGACPCTDGTAQVRIVTSAPNVAPTAILSCDGPSVQPVAAGNTACVVINNGQGVDVNCGTTAGANPPSNAASVTCSSFNFNVQSSLGACLANPLPLPTGLCQVGANLGAGQSVTIQITWIATPGNGGATGGINILPSATLIFSQPGISALVVSAAPYSIPSNGTLASVITATFSCTGPLATQANFLAPGALNSPIAGQIFAPFVAGATACNPGLPGTFNFNSLGPVIFDNGRQSESVSCGPPGSLNTFGVGAISGFGVNNLTPPLTYTCTGAAVLAIGAGAAGDAPINVTFQSAVGGVNAIGSTLLSVVPSGAPVIGIQCNPSTIAAGGLGSICVATVTDINRVPLSGLTGATVTFTVSDPTQATVIPCVVNIPQVAINVTTSPNVLPQLLPGGPCSTPTAGIPGQVNTFVNGQASAVVVPSPTAHPGPVTVTATLGILIPPSFSCLSAPYATGIPTGLVQPVIQNVPALGNPGLYGCGAAAPYGVANGFTGLATGLSQASFGYTGIVTLPNATSASTVVQIGGQFGILIAGATPTAPLILTRGCNQMIVTTATGTPVANIAALVSPQSAVVSIWRFDNGTKQFKAGFFSDPAAPTDFATTGGTTTANVAGAPANTPIVGGGAAIVNSGAQITETYFICVNATATIVSG